MPRYKQTANQLQRQNGACSDAGMPLEGSKGHLGRRERSTKAFVVFMLLTLRNLGDSPCGKRGGFSSNLLLEHWHVYMIVALVTGGSKYSDVPQTKNML